MIFIYDIFINPNEEFYDFYEWDEFDNIKHIRKSPLIKVKGEVISKIIEKNLIINKVFLNNIFNKCELFKDKKIEYVKYGCIFSDKNRSIFCNFNDEGYIEKISSVSISEELEILDIVETLEEKDIKYKLDNKKYIKSSLTREQKIIINSILNELNNIKDDNDKLEYLYYEWFNEKGFSYEKLVNDIKKEFSNKHLEFIELLKLVV